jgi:hypothetical protein
MIYDVTLVGFPPLKQALGLSAAQHYAAAWPTNRPLVILDMMKTDGLTIHIARDKVGGIVAKCVELEPQIG